MKRFAIILSSRAILQLADLRNYISADSGAARASAFINSIVDYCEGFLTFPERGTRRDDILPGLRTIGFKRCVTIAFTIEARTVAILGVFYGGQDFEAVFRDE